MLLPKRVKYRRVQRGRMTGKATRGNVVCQGQYGLVALEPAWISSKQIEAARAPAFKSRPRYFMLYTQSFSPLIYSGSVILKPNARNLASAWRRELLSMISEWLPWGRCLH